MVVGRGGGEGTEVGREEGEGREGREEGEGREGRGRKGKGGREGREVAGNNIPYDIIQRPYCF